MGDPRHPAPREWVVPSVTPPVVPGYQPIFLPHTISGRCVHISGRLAKQDGQILIGRVGAELSLDEVCVSARGVALELLASLRDAAGTLDRIATIGRLFVMVRSAEIFPDVHVVANAVSEVLISALGERGRHARSVVGAFQLPFGACLEAELSATLITALGDPGALTEVLRQ